jgi:chromosome segregation ATPase
MLLRLLNRQFPTDWNGIFSVASKLTIMNMRVLLAIVFCSTLFGCNQSRYSQLKKENDSLKVEIENRKHILTVLKDASILLDSIDQSRNADLELRKSRVDERLVALHQYVQQSEERVGKMEKELRSARLESNAYLLMVDALKGELGIRVDEVYGLEESVGTYHRENRSLAANVTDYQKLVLDLKDQIAEKHRKLDELENEVVSMENKLNLSEAEREYARAQRIERVSRKIMWAPEKKRETMREALEVYKKALVLGKKEAQQNIAMLEDALLPG